jgi:putative heme-binding domain-containing protein
MVSSAGAQPCNQGSDGKGRMNLGELGLTLASFGQTNVWMLVPGFTVHELPLKLSNINNLRFTPADPNATINPDYVAYNVALRDGNTINGFVRAQANDNLRVTTADGKEQVVRHADLADMHPSPVSLMPTGLFNDLNEGQVHDLLTFLLNQAPIRSPGEVEAAGRFETNHVSAPKLLVRPLNIVLVASKQDHGPGQHDYPGWQTKWMTLLSQRSSVTLTKAWEWPSEEQCLGPTKYLHTPHPSYSNLFPKLTLPSQAASPSLTCWMNPTGRCSAIRTESKWLQLPIWTDKPAH